MENGSNSEVSRSFIRHPSYIVSQGLSVGETVVFHLRVDLASNSLKVFINKEVTTARWACAHAVLTLNSRPRRLLPLLRKLSQPSALNYLTSCLTYAKHTLETQHGELMTSGVTSGKAKKAGFFTPEGSMARFRLHSKFSGTLRCTE